MTKKPLQKIENGFYEATRIVAIAGTVVGLAGQAFGLITESDNLFKFGMYAVLPSLGYLLGTEAGEDQFKSVSDLEKTLE